MCVYLINRLIYTSYRVEIPYVSTVKVVMFEEIDQRFAADLLQELARAYSASSNTRTQVNIYRPFLCIKCTFIIDDVGLLCICYSRSITCI